MPEAPLLVVAWFAALAGMVWLALTLDGHWRQVRGAAPLSRRSERLLRAGGAAALCTSLWLCLRADHLTMAPLVWVMGMTGAALTVAFALAWRPRWLAPLVFWAGR